MILSSIKLKYRLTRPRKNRYTLLIKKGKNMKKSLLFALCSLLFAPLTASAVVCPVCTIAVGGLLVFFESIGIPDIIFAAIWSGALTLSLAIWTANYMQKKGVRHLAWYILDYIAYYGLLLLVYVFPTSKPVVRYGERMLWNLDQFLLGVVLGTAFLYLGGLWYARIKKKNGGKAWFPFQKVVWPVGVVLALTFVLAAILYWLPAVGVVLY